ncbi:MAG: galactokinase family protein, partial [Sphaerochaetaceae bacterium]|nr:galactokinase family protein [Sphaerochaetaceae bacterium]
MTDLHGLRSYIESEAFTALLVQLYGDARDLVMQQKRYARLIDSWYTRFPTHAHHMTGLFSTAGRSELAGNHTDHNLGKVIAATINLDTIAVASASDDMTV